MICQRRIPLEGAFNMRDLGGYPAKGGTTRFQVFYRADALEQLTPADIQVLTSRGLRLVVDLRASDETRDYNKLEAAGIRVAHCPILDTTAGSMPNHQTDLGDVYLYMLERFGDRFVQALNLLAEEPGLALYHCKGGKDRTGLLSAMLLLLCGVSVPDVLVDYMQTYTYMRATFDAKEHHGIPAQFMHSDPEFLEKALNYWDKAGGVRTWLLQKGADESKLAALVARLVEPNV